MEKDKRRTEWVSFRCTKAEKEEILRAFKKSGYTSLATFVRRSVLNTYIVVVDPFLYKAALDATQKWVVEVNRVGNNINQIAKVIHERKIPKKEWLTRVREDLHALRMAVDESDVAIWKDMIGRR